MSDQRGRELVDGNVAALVGDSQVRLWTADEIPQAHRPPPIPVRTANEIPHGHGELSPTNMSLAPDIVSKEQQLWAWCTAEH